jgi:hypothetical protein
MLILPYRDEPGLWYRKAAPEGYRKAAPEGYRKAASEGYLSSGKSCQVVLWFKTIKQQVLDEI